MKLKTKGGHHETKDDYLTAFSWRDSAMELTAARSLNVVCKTANLNH